MTSLLSTVRDGAMGHTFVAPRLESNVYRKRFHAIQVVMATALTLVESNLSPLAGIYTAFTDVYVILSIYSQSPFLIIALHTSILPWPT
jgi:hypothetical protein